MGGSPRLEVAFSGLPCYTVYHEAVEVQNKSKAERVVDYVGLGVCF